MSDKISFQILFDEKCGDNDDEKRIWCTVTYGAMLHSYNSVVRSISA
jgi:hypothetical protein